jgi:N6-adenosine-specific RNA methylase IME4
MPENTNTNDFFQSNILKYEIRDDDKDSRVDSPKTGYSIYREEQKKRELKNHLSDLYPVLPSEKFQIIYADPPWDYGGKMQFDKTSVSAEKIDLSRNIFISSASFKYPTLKLPELKKLDLNSISDSDCLLFMWTTNPHLNQDLELGKAWGFEYKTVGFVWNKMVHNPGKYTMSYCELCLIFKKGRIPSPRGARNIKQLVEAPRGRHSEKPFEVRMNIEKMFPSQKKIELFARSQNSGWRSWGLDAFEQPQGSQESIDEQPIT